MAFKVVTMPVQLLLPGRRRPLRFAVEFSVALHVGLLALIILGTKPSSQRAKAISEEVVPETPVVYFAIAPPAPVAAPAVARPRTTLRRTRLHRLSTQLFAVTPVARLDTVPDLLKPLKPRLNLTPNQPLQLPVLSSASQVAERPGRVSRSADLMGGTAAACPEIRRPSSGPYSKGRIEVAVAFVVDTMGSVDYTSLRVVESPGTPPPPPEFFPHIYVIGSTARVDHKIHHSETTYESLVVGDVLRHIAGLKFRPALRNGAPVPSSAILVACQAT